MKELESLSMDLQKMYSRERITGSVLVDNGGLFCFFELIVRIIYFLKEEEYRKLSLAQRIKVMRAFQD